MEEKKIRKTYGYDGYGINEIGGYGYWFKFVVVYLRFFLIIVYFKL